MSKIGTLEELNVKPGDVVECVWKPIGGVFTVGKTYRMTNKGLECDADSPQLSTVSTFRIISRAPDTPKLWRDMTDAEKGALLLAHLEGKVIEVFVRDIGWEPCKMPFWKDHCAYRIRPKPKRLTVPLMADNKEIGTIDLVDGKPDQSSIKMGETL